MRITCPSCGAAGRLKKPPTAPVRCPKCKERWDPRAAAEEEEGAEEEEEEEAPARPRKRRRRPVEPSGGESRPRKRARTRRGDRGEDDSERPAPRRRRGRRGRPSSASGEREDHERRGGRRRRSKTTLPLIVGGVALVLIGAIGGTVWFLQNRGGGGAPDALRSRAEGYVRAFRGADADAMFGYLHPSDIERIRNKQGEAGLKMVKSLLSLGANMLQSAQQAGAKIEVVVSKVTATGDRGTVELTTSVEHEGKAESRKNSMTWTRHDGTWYLSSPGAQSPNPAHGPTPEPAGEDDTAPAEPAASEDPPAPDGAAEEDDADVDITAPD